MVWWFLWLSWFSGLWDVFCGALGICFLGLLWYRFVLLVVGLGVVACIFAVLVLCLA